MITEQLENVIKKYNITETKNIIYGTNIPMPHGVLITPLKTYIKLDKTEYYFFLFNEKGVTLYTRDGENSATILWKDIIDFKISHISIIGKMAIKTKDTTYKFQLNRFVVGCHWIKENTKYLESKNYFYNK